MIVKKGTTPTEVIVCIICILILLTISVLYVVSSQRVVSNFRFEELKKNPPASNIYECKVVFLDDFLAQFEDSHKEIFIFKFEYDEYAQKTPLILIKQLKCGTFYKVTTVRTSRSYFPIVIGLEKVR